MRHGLLFLLFFTAPWVNAQLWEQALQPSEQVQLGQALPVGGGKWAVMGRTTFAGSHLISVRNADGSVAWEQQGPYEVDNDMGQVILLPDSGLLHIGIFDGCDYFGPDSRLRRYSPQGDILWERLFPESSTYPLSMVAPGSTDHLAVASGNFVYILDLGGNTAGGFQVPSGDLRAIHWASDSTLFAVMGTSLRLVNLQGVTLASRPIGTNVRDLHGDGQQLFVLVNDSIHRFSSDLLPLGSQALAGLDWNSRFMASDGSLYVNTASGLYQLAEDGSPAFLFAWPALPNLATTGCAVRNGTVLAVGNTSISGRSTGIIRTLSMDGEAPAHQQDVEVLIRVDTAWSDYIGGAFYSWNRSADVTGFVVNHGPDTLRSVVLSMWIPIPALMCEQPANRIDTAGLALAPGDTIALPFGVVHTAMGLTQSQVLNTTGEICIVALAPDRLADRNPDDNTACATVDFTLGLVEPMGPAPLLLFPNPATDRCTVSGLATLGTPVHVRVMDLAGRTMAERFGNTSGNNLELDVSDLPPGTYVLDIMGAQARSTAKLMVVRP